MNIEEILQAVSEELSGVGTGDAVLGSPVQMGAVTIYPISLVSVALGGGGGEGEVASEAGTRPEKGVGGGSGGGARACPVAVLVVGGEGGVKVLPLPQRKGAMERLLDKIPDLVGRVKTATCA